MELPDSQRIRVLNQIKNKFLEKFKEILAQRKSACPAYKITYTGSRSAPQVIELVSKSSNEETAKRNVEQPLLSVNSTIKQPSVEGSAKGVSLLKSSLKTSSQYSTFNCKKCGTFRTSSREEYQEHFKTSHRNLRPCSVCNKFFRSDISLHIHYKIRHGIDGSTLKCDLCAYKARKPEDLRHHLRHAHVNNGPFKCRICEKEIFGGRKVFKEHLMLHAGDRAHMCQFCDKRFISEGRVKAHINNVHLAQNEFKCNICSKGFQTKYALQRHEMLHKSEKPYKCDECQYSSSFMSNLTAHKRRIHKRDNYTAGKALKEARKVLGGSESDHR